MAKIKDIAKRLGVSTATVSYVLNGTKKMNPETVKRVLKAAKDMNYQPNQQARSLVTGTSKIVLIIINDIMDLFFSTLANGAEEVLRKAGYLAIIGSTNEEADKLTEYLNLSSSFKAAGIIISPTSSVNSLKKQLNEYNIPIVQVNRYTKIIDSDVVVTDNFSAVYSATLDLINKGHKRICLITGKKSISTYSARIAGFKKALSENGLLKANEDLILSRSGRGFEIGYKLFHTAMENPSKPTVVIGGGSTISKGIYRAIIENSYAIPEDISFIGFDILGWSYLLKDPVDEIAQNIRKMGKMAAEILIKRIENKDEEKVFIELPARLIKGKSVKEL